ncbi:ras-like protein [Anaeramoeba ignava]|uniref:small monomeric GTPase n=1 Tax=Anaeramoeba ignava TaxID=1746090 RepID=A0A9Q0RA42_ANAIG|nr:ras-like protein [Anaeramoeba ignava]|eukprot:Anaeramoba_ignava/a90892_54.p1 GENE.a90892_54~~a90892_54.p1  ORF type:complete len:199 (-),score=62.68 a90892_54:241-837(-)
MSKEYYKIVLIGGGSVGKSCLTVQYLHGRFHQDYDPTIEQSYQKETEIDNKEVTLEIIDTAGQEEYRSVRDKYISTGQAFLIVYSIISRTSFIEAKQLHQAVKRAKGPKGAPVITVANKSDLHEERVVTVESGEELAAEFSSLYFETSAKTGSNVAECFQQLVRELRKRKDTISENQPKSNPQKEVNKSEGGGCCIIL